MRRSGVRSSSAPPIELNGAGSPGIPILAMLPDVAANRRVVDGTYASAPLVAARIPELSAYLMLLYAAQQRQVNSDGAR